MSDATLNQNGPPPVRLALPAMATRFELVLAGDDPRRLQAIGEAALREIADCEAAISPFLAGSAVARVNREAHAAPVRVDSQTYALLERCAALTAATGGAFDVTVGPLLRALGFRGMPPGNAAAIAAARAAVGMELVELDPVAETVRFLRPGMALDLGAIGKGFALDRAAAVLREHGVEAALLHGGTSTVVALGAPPGSDGWRVGVGPWSEPPVAVLRDAALSVSAGHGRVVGDRGHVLDPRRGKPVGWNLAATAAVARDATAADAWSTALLVGTAAAPPPATVFLVAHRADAAVRWQRRGDLAVDIEFPATGCFAPATP